MAITFHHVAQRIPYLLDVVRALNDFPVRAMRIAVMVNAVEEAELGRVRAILEPGLCAGKSLVLQRCADIGHPFNLTWQHKRLITNLFLTPEAGFTHFIYLEDDIRFGFANFAYFVRWRPLLAEHGLIPSFVRVEYAAEAKEMRLTDHGQTLRPGKGKPVPATEAMVFIPPPAPYCAMFVLDRILAEEYVATRSFDLEASKQVTGWDVRERAAAGLCWEAPPPGYRSRYVVAINPTTGRYLPEAWVPHLPNNYANKPGTSFGKLSVLARQPGEAT
ncbi:hypothetical protein [Roseomonas rosulenta]|uniref:hypothetical protein n=1 Tax=Roseomonas rosulenta TaxID=2748667 RepID=UPI0018E01888|nr:hypothetical protein [Roseomonas rosulenta]